MNDTLVVDDVSLDNHGGSVTRHDVGSSVVRHEGKHGSSGRSVVGRSESVGIGSGSVDDVVGENGLNRSLVQAGELAGDGADGSVIGRKDGQSLGRLKSVQQARRLNDAGQRREKVSSKSTEIRREGEDLVDNVDLQVGGSGGSHGGHVGLVENLKHLCIARVSSQDDGSGSVTGQGVLSAIQQSSGDRVHGRNLDTGRSVRVVENVVREDLGKEGSVGRDFLGDGGKGGVVGSKDSLVALRELAEEGHAFFSGRDRGSDTDQPSQVGRTIPLARVSSHSDDCAHVKAPRTCWR